nr:immunoglobulin light chain junction region [Macaca mulatta]MOY10333.1 immunoglobulin light chain junction region [Macaca mulatta]MOY11211.1 immunoglobulin light chain junction region [Macaca mulatta]MOY11762.1 immunoglobulin light chain junction region [Macaca mulatta]MOY12355.1 immunoglobulin light chain junction region [Macaca mulatta]
CQQGNSIPPTF